MALVRGNEGRALKNIIAQAMGAVVLNRERAAIQIIDCRGFVALHLPVKNELLKALAVQGL